MRIAVQWVLALLLMCRLQWAARFLVWLPKNRMENFTQCHWSMRI